MAHVSRQFASELGQLAGMRAWVHEICSRAWGLKTEADALDQLVLAVQEAATNVIRHACADLPEQQIELDIDAAANEASVTIFHRGRDFDPHLAKQPVFDGSQEGGFGVYLIAHLVDEVDYFKDETGRSGIRLVKRRKES